jgi:hypothetical protein
MLEAIAADEVHATGRALEVRYRGAPGGGGLLVVSMAAHDVDGTPTHVRRSEVAFVATDEAMTREAMRARAEAEAARRAISRVAWIEEEA